MTGNVIYTDVKSGEEFRQVTEKLFWKIYRDIFPVMKYNMHNYVFGII